MSDTAQLRLEVARRLGWTDCLNFEDSGLVGYNPLGYFERLPDWPGSIAAAWELVEMMREAYAEPAVIWHGDNKYWFCSFVSNGRIFTPCHGETAPIAICRAWCAWKEGQA